jgi:UDP-glucose 4-epimerase
MANILITGGAGQLGSALAEKLAKDSSNTIVIVDNLSTGNKENVFDLLGRLV